MYNNYVIIYRIEVSDISSQQLLSHAAIIFGTLLVIPIICVLLLSQSGGRLQTAVMSLFPGYFGRLILLPGVVIHELSHWIAAKIFLIKVTEVKLFIFDPTSQTLGYVRSAYNPNSIWQRLGETVSGIAPLFGITGTVSGVYYLMFSKYLQVNIDHTQPVKQQLQALFQALIDPVSGSAGIGRTVIFIAIMIILLTGFSLSSADLHTALVGLGPLIGLLALLTLASIYAPSILKTASVCGIVIVSVTGFLLLLTLLGIGLIWCIRTVI